MSGFTKTFTVTEVFDGDTITIEMKRLRNEHMIVLTPYFVESENGDTKVRFKDNIEKLSVGSKVIPDQVVRFEGCKDKEGRPLGINDIVGEMYFSELVDRLIAHLFVQANPRLQEKKSDKPLPEPVTALVAAEVQEPSRSAA